MGNYQIPRKHGDRYNHDERERRNSDNEHGYWNDQDRSTGVDKGTGKAGPGHKACCGGTPDDEAASEDDDEEDIVIGVSR